MKNQNKQEKIHQKTQNSPR